MAQGERTGKRLYQKVTPAKTGGRVKHRQLGRAIRRKNAISTLMVARSNISEDRLKKFGYERCMTTWPDWVHESKATVLIFKHNGTETIIVPPSVRRKIDISFSEKREWSPFGLNLPMSRCGGIDIMVAD